MLSLYYILYYILEQRAKSLDKFKELCLVEPIPPIQFARITKTFQ